MKVSWCLFFMVLSCNILCAQNITGTWEGELVQENSTFSNQYKLTLTLKQVGKKISGTAAISIEKISAEVELSGKMIAKNVYELNEIRILRHTEEKNQEWCLGRFLLNYEKTEKGRELSGFFDSKTTFSTCPVSKIKLVKGVPRA